MEIVGRYQDSDTYMMPTLLHCPYGTKGRNP